MPVVNGNWTAPNKAFVKGKYLSAPIKLRGGADGWEKKELDECINTPIHQLGIARGIAMDIEQHAVELSGSAEEALASLKTALDKFRSTIGNDLTSMKSASSRIQSEALQIKQTYQAAQSLLTTPEFEKAVSNAERMATALKAISELSETKLSVAVFSGGKPT